MCWVNRSRCPRSDRSRNVFQDLIIDLRQPPKDRWHLTPVQREQARELLGLYKADLGLRPDIGDPLLSTAKDLIRGDYWDGYQKLDVDPGSVPQRLLTTCCQRLDRVDV